MKHILFVLILSLLVGCSGITEYKETRELMGTIVTITVYGDDKAFLKESVEDAFDEIIRIDALLSNYKNDSDVSLLNSQKYITGFSDDLKINIEKSVYYSKISNGSFDITVQPILDLYSESFAAGGPPSDDQIREKLGMVNFRYINYSDDIIAIHPKQKITLGGIAKGYAVDKAIEVLQGKGIQSALVNAGGDMMTIGTKPDGEKWNVALADPRDKKNTIDIIELNGNAVVTSGDYERYFTEDKSFHHIVDPRTGYSATELISVTIVADNAMDADAISTAVFVLGREKGAELMKELGVYGTIVTANKYVIRIGPACQSDDDCEEGFKCFKDRNECFIICDAGYQQYDARMCMFGV